LTAAPRILRVVATVALALAGLALALWFFTANDDATTRAPDAVVPGTPASDPVAWAPELRQGNLMLIARDAAAERAARALARDVAGADYSPDLRATGQAIRVLRLAACVQPGCDVGPLPQAPGGEDAAVVAYAHDRVAAARAVSDPALRRFLEYWLGRGA
jgi:hypothetical protein